MTDRTVIGRPCGTHRGECGGVVEMTAIPATRLDPPERHLWCMKCGEPLVDAEVEFYEEAGRC